MCGMTADEAEASGVHVSDHGHEPGGGSGGLRVRLHRQLVLAQRLKPAGQLGGILTHLLQVFLLLLQQI